MWIRKKGKNFTKVSIRERTNIEDCVKHTKEREEEDQTFERFATRRREAAFVFLSGGREEKVLGHYCATENKGLVSSNTCQE